MAAPYEHLAQIERIVAGFVDCTLPCEEWTHRAHLTVGLWHAGHYPADEALNRVRDGIQRYNQKCGVVDSPTRGYHETLTCFYMRVIGSYLSERADRTDWVALTNHLVEQCGNRDFPLGYYSRERLMSSEARADWVPPDLRMLE